MKKGSEAVAAPKAVFEERKTRVKKIMPILRREYPHHGTALHYGTPCELLVATILSAQCTDERVNQVTPGLFARYRTVEDFEQADQQELEEMVRPTGFYHNKAKSIRESARRIVGVFHGEVPNSMEDLLTLTGVARKTANVVLGDAFKKAEGVVVDTHVLRLVGRLDLSDHKDPDKIERDLMELVPKRHWISFPHTLIYHGRNVCKARKPDCPSCLIKKLCPSAILG